MSSPALTPPQLHALFDILTHAETFSEIEEFKSPDACANYGYPFVKARDGDSLTFAPRSHSPILQMLLKNLILTLPAARDIPLEFWNVRIQGLVTKLAEAELSESYDKGAMGTRKTLATAASAIIEVACRGRLGGCAGGPVEDLKSQTYDTTSAKELARAWDDVMRDMVYGNLINELFDFAVEDGHIENHSAAVRGAIDWFIIQLAGFLHKVCVVSPEGPYIIKLLENVHKLVPYSVIRQTLRVSNAATMINGMMKLLLAKLSIGGLTNWIGWTSNADDGMNLLQRIISAVLYWDSADFKKSIDKIEKAKDGPSPEQQAAIKEHINQTRETHEELRSKSREQYKSIINTVFEAKDSELCKSLSQAQHSQSMEYYSTLLSVRDREEIVNVLCRQNPDLFTQSLREAVAAFDPIIRQVHDKIDLKEHITDGEGFIGEFIKVGKGSKSNGLFPGNPKRKPSSVKDYVELLRNNRHLMYKWLHRVASQTPEIRDMFREWAVDNIKLFRNPDAETRPTDASDAGGRAHLADGAGAMDGHLLKLFDALPDDKKQSLITTLDAHAKYLTALDERSTDRLQTILGQVNGSNESRNPTGDQAPGPGMYLASWQNLMDETLITPGEPQGPVRHGRDVKNSVTQGKIGALASGKNSRAASPAPSMDERGTVQSLDMPDARMVVELLRPAFRELLAELNEQS